MAVRDTGMEKKGVMDRKKVRYGWKGVDGERNGGWVGELLLVVYSYWLLELPR